MKRVFKIIIFLLIIVISYFFNKTYFIKNENDFYKLNEINDQIINNGKNNLIKNLNYNVRLDDNIQYTISSDLSEIIKDESKEVIEMIGVKAVILDNELNPIVIKSKNATYNNSSYDTKFRNNVTISYLNNIISSDKIDVDFKRKIIKIFDNVRYEGLDSEMFSDNIELNINTKNVRIFMNDDNSNIKINKIY